jgi:hypothetical protein
MEDIIPYNFVPFLGPFQGFNWGSVTHIMPMSQLKIGVTYKQSSSSKKRKLNNNDYNNSNNKSNKKNDNSNDYKNDDNSDNKNEINNTSIKNDENSSHQNRHKESIQKFKKECVWWGWTILDPSQLGTTFITFY